jgi:hypothetical protein
MKVCMIGSSNMGSYKKKTHYSLIRSHSSRKKLKAIGEPITLLDTAPNTLAQSCFLIPELLETAHSKYLNFILLLCSANFVSE